VIDTSSNTVVATVGVGALPFGVAITPGSAGNRCQDVVCTADQCHNPGMCNPATGVCSAPANKTDGTPCNDANACTQTDSCQAGICVGANPVTCTASDQCHVAGVCDPTTGACSNPFATNGTPCNDNNACSSDETCQSGMCTNSCGLTGPQDTCTAAKFTGGGQFNEPDTWSFGFNAKGIVSGSASGHFNAIHHATGAQINGDVTAITCFNAATNTMTFDVSVGSCTYQVTVHDGGDPGAGRDSISITTTSGGSCPAGGGGTLTHGNIQSH